MFTTTFEVFKDCDFTERLDLNNCTFTAKIKRNPRDTDAVAEFDVSYDTEQGLLTIELPCDVSSGIKLRCGGVGKTHTIRDTFVYDVFMVHGDIKQCLAYGTVTIQAGVSDV